MILLFNFLTAARTGIALCVPFANAVFVKNVLTLQRHGFMVTVFETNGTSGTAIRWTNSLKSYRLGVSWPSRWL